ncbi:hypothetical protein RJ640_018169 [Escallonia rubra]|uniref:Uncharacterized protein n=1 Tax=Escallonia rubra TaxID=112253 RepID=A0AA88UQY5_9ASTE|nr:hypothetical protein RJ640_018169 [Escallonia rubra]
MPLTMRFLPSWTLGEIREQSLLDLSGNALTGLIPPQLSLCKQLTHIDLNDNLEFTTLRRAQAFIESTYRTSPSRPIQLH